MKQWSWKAILGGLAVDCLGGLVVGVVLVIPFVVGAAQSGNLKNGSVDIGFSSSTPFLILSLIAGLFMDVLGGYFTALWAPTGKIAHSILTGIGSVLFGFLLNSTGQDEHPLWFSLSWLLVIPCAALGGWWRVKTHGPESKPKRESSSPAAPIASPFGD